MMSLGGFSQGDRKNGYELIIIANSINSIKLLMSSLTALSTQKLTVRIWLVILSMCYLMKSTPADFAADVSPSRKVIPMVIGSPKMAIKLVLQASTAAPPPYQVQFSRPVRVFPLSPPFPPGSTKSGAGPELEKCHLPRFHPGLCSVSVPWNCSVQVYESALQRDFCPLRRSVFFVEEEEAESEVPLVVAILYRSAFKTRGIAVLHTFIFQPFPDFFLLCKLGDFGSTQYIRPNLYGYFDGVNTLMHWSEALYITLRRKGVKQTTGYGLLLLGKVLPGIIYCGLWSLPAVVLVTPAYLFFKVFGWLASYSMFFFYSFSNFLYFSGYVTSLWILFSGVSVIPFSIAALGLLRRDWLIYRAMPEPEDLWLQRARQRVFYLVSRKGCLLNQLFRAYRELGLDVELKKARKKRWKRGYLYWFEDKLVPYQTCCKLMYDELYRALKLSTNFVKTSQDSTTWFDMGSRWKFNGYTYQFISGICAHLPFGWGFYLSPVAGQFIQDLLLFTIKYIYIATDPRAVKNVALACEFLQFRNSPLGITLSSTAGDWLSDYLKNVMEDLEKLVQRGFDKLDDAMGLSWEERCRANGVPVGGPLGQSRTNRYSKRRWQGDLNQRGIFEDQHGVYRHISQPEPNYSFVPTSFEVSVEGLIKMLGGFENVLRSQITKRVLQVLAVLVAIFSFSKSGTFTTEGMTRVMNAMKSQQFDESVDMLSYFVSVLKWLAETGWHLFRFPTSSLSPENSLVWKEKAEKLLLVEKCAGFAECTGAGVLTVDGKLLPLTQLRSQVLQLIKIDWPTVEAALKITSSKFIISEFKALKNRLVIFESVLAKKVLSQQYRFQPFGVALTGGTSVGKSNVSNTIFAYLSALDGLEHSPEMVFSRNPLTVFWDTFVAQRYILFDDVGAIHPQSKLPDTSLIDVLQVANNAPYVPPMAAADEKGTQCITSAALIATSNFMNLNAHVMFGCPAAIYRRFHVWTVMAVKPRFADHAGRLDPGKIASFWLGVNETDPGLRFNRQFPPYWDFSVHATGDEIEDDPLVVFNDPDTSLLDYLDYIRQAYENHKKAQERVMQSHSAMKQLSLCPMCKLPRALCVPASGCAAHTALVPTMREGKLEDELDFIEVGQESEDDQQNPGTVIDLYWGIVFGLLASILFGLFYSFGLITLSSIVCLLWGIFARCFVYFGILHLTMSLAKSTFTEARDACSVSDTMYLPYWAISYLFSRASTAVTDLGQFLYIVARGGFSRSAFVEACLKHANGKLKKVVTVKNGIIVLLIIALIALARQPAYRLLKSTLVMTMQNETQKDPVSAPSGLSRETILKDFVLPGKEATPAVVEDSRSAWYNPYPPMDTRTDDSRCLNGDSGALFVESTLRRATCNLEFTSDNGDSSVVRGLAIGGNIILTCAHALYTYQGGQVTHRACRGVVSFPSMIEGRVTKSEFQILSSNVYMNVEEDWALITVPTMAPRKSLVNLFVERSHSFPTVDVKLKSGAQVKVMTNKAVLVNPLGLNWFESWQKRVGGPGCADQPPGYLETNTFFGKVTNPSSYGMSGSTLASTTGGVCILGLQCMSDKGDFSLVLSTFIGRTQLKDAIKALGEKSKLNQFADISRDGIVGKDTEPPEMTSTPTRKNPLNFPGLEEYNFSFVATLRQVIGSPSSRFAHPPYREFFRAKGYISDKEKPIFDWKSKRNYLSQIAQISPNIDIGIVDEVSSVLLDHWVMAYGSELAILETLSLSDAINGNDRVTWVERLKMDTSAGFPWNVRKSELLEVRPVPQSVRACGFEYSLPDNLLAEFQLYFMRLIQREPATYPYKGTQKDEPISPEKNFTRGPRLFCAANLYVILAGRMLFGSYIRLAQRNPFISWAAVGMNAASKMWGLLWVFISYFGTHRMIAGDYGNFDQNMSPVFTTAAYAVIIGLLKASGNYNDEEICAAQSWAFEAIYPTVLIDGDIFSIAGTNPSGNPLTVHVNCVVNILYVMYIWVSVGKDSRQFFLYVRMITYGDDNIISVHDSITGFDFWVIHVQLARIGVKYTPADKSRPEEGRSFDPPGDVAFLKRLFVERDGFVYAPLDFSSICKTFNCWMTSQDPDEAHGLATFVSVWENACHYDDDLCDRIHQDILEYCELAGWPTHHFVPKQSVRDRFKEAEVNRYETLVEQVHSHFVQTSLDAPAPETEGPPLRCLHSAQYPSMHSRYYSSSDGFEKIFRDFCSYAQRGIQMMFQGLAFSTGNTSEHVSRWYIAQDGSWLQFWNIREGFGTPHGAGIVPLVENELESDESDSDSVGLGGCYDGFYLVSGPEEDAQFSERPIGPC